MTVAVAAPPSTPHPTRITKPAQHDRGCSSATVHPLPHPHHCGRAAAELGPCRLAPQPQRALTCCDVLLPPPQAQPMARTCPLSPANGPHLPPQPSLWPSPAPSAQPMALTCSLSPAYGPLSPALLICQPPAPRITSLFPGGGAVHCPAPPRRPLSGCHVWPCLRHDRQARTAAAVAWHAARSRQYHPAVEHRL